MAIDETIRFETKSHYGGPELIYVISDHKEPLQTLTGSKTLTDRHVKALKELGFKFEENDKQKRVLAKEDHKMSTVTERLDRIASYLEPFRPDIALGLDRISDRLADYDQTKSILTRLGSLWEELRDLSPQANFEKRLYAIEDAFNKEMGFNPKTKSLYEFTRPAVELYRKMKGVKEEKLSHEELKKEFDAARDGIRMIQKRYKITFLPDIEREEDSKKKKQEEGRQQELEKTLDKIRPFFNNDENLIASFIIAEHKDGAWKKILYWTESAGTGTARDSVVQRKAIDLVAEKARSLLEENRSKLQKASEDLMGYIDSTIQKLTSEYLGSAPDLPSYLHEQFQRDTKKYQSRFQHPYHSFKNQMDLMGNLKPSLKKKFEQGYQKSKQMYEQILEDFKSIYTQAFDEAKKETKRLAKLAECLDTIASEIEPESPVVALALDRISDQIRNAARTPITWEQVPEEIRSFFKQKMTAYQDRDEIVLFRPIEGIQIPSAEMKELVRYPGFKMLRGSGRNVEYVFEMPRYGGKVKLP